MHKLGIIGLGVIFNYQWRALKKQSYFEVTSLCDFKVKVLDLDLLNTHNIHLYEDYKELLKSDCESVLISLPLSLHYIVARDALNAGKNVLLEKPAVLTKKELEELYSVAEENGVLLHIAYHASFAKDLLWFLNAKDGFTDKFGRITAVMQKFFDPYMTPKLILDKVNALGDSWIDSGINALSVANRILPLNSARLLKTVYRKSDSVVTKMESSFVVEESDNKSVIVRIHTDWSLNMNYKMTEEIFENGSVIELNHSKQGVFLYTADGKEELLDCSGEERLVVHYCGVFDDFKNVLNTRKTNKESSKVIHELLISVMNSYEESMESKKEF